VAIPLHQGRHRSDRTTPGDAVGVALLCLRAGSRFVLTVVTGLVIVGLAPGVLGWRPSVISSGSMLPALAIGDLVVAAPAAPGTIEPNDVVIFTDPAAPGGTVVHRVVAANPDGTFTTAGDANPVVDSTPLAAAAVDGRVRLRIPYVGLPRYWLASRQWLPLAALCAVLATLVVCSGPPVRPATRRRRQRGRRA
jgi:signal peptidase